MRGAEVEDESDWPKCESQGCTGILLPRQEFCLAHVDEAARATFSADFLPGSHLDLRGTSIDPDLLAAVMDVVREDENPRIGSAWFDRRGSAGGRCSTGRSSAGTPGSTGGVQQGCRVR